MDDKEYLIESSLPVVIQVKEGSLKSAPVSFRDRVESFKKPITLLSAESFSSDASFGYRHSPTRVRKMVAPDRTRQPLFYVGNDAVAKFSQILEEYEGQGERDTDCPFSRSTARRDSAREKQGDLTPEGPVAVYVEAHEGGFQHGLELLSHLQACGCLLYTSRCV